MRALILSAGLGERLRPLTLTRAKPAIEFLNVPMLGFPYYWLNKLGLSDIAFNTHHLPDTVRHAAMHVVDPKISLHFPFEKTILGSGGGIQNAKVYLEGDDEFVVANGDGVVLFKSPDTLSKMLKFHKSQNALATLLVCPLEGVGTKIPGVWIKNSGEVVGFGKDLNAADTKCFHYASYMIFSKRIWNYLPDGSSNILYDVLTPEIQKGDEKVFGFKVDDMLWFETGNSSEYLAATKTCLKLMADNQNPLGQRALEIVSALSPESELKGTALISAHAFIEGEILGHSVIAKDAHVARGAKVVDSVLLAGAYLKCGETVKDVILIV